MTVEELNAAYPGMPWEQSDANWVNVCIAVEDGARQWVQPIPAS